MRGKIIIYISLILMNTSFAQEIIELPYEEIPRVEWTNAERAYYSEEWDNPVVTNVSVPTMEVFRPETPNGTSVIVAPGGGLYALSIESEGTKVGEWLAEKGVTAFVLKYRLVPTGEDGVKDLTKDGPEVVNKVKKVLPYSVNDAINAIDFVRSNASAYKLKTDRIGIMGFSAGGAVVMGATFRNQKGLTPDFVVPVYAWTSVFDVQEAPKEACPMFVVCSTDDPLGLAAGSVALYNAWLSAGKPVGMQMYAKGGHGYGMKKQNLPSDHWIERFYEWLVAQELVQN